MFHKVLEGVSPIRGTLTCFFSTTLCGAGSAVGGCCFGLCSLQNLQGLGLGQSIWGCGTPVCMYVVGEKDTETESSTRESEGK